MAPAVTATTTVSPPSDISATTARGYAINEPGSHNIAMGAEHPYQVPKFASKEAERQWVKEHMAAAFRIFARKGYTEGTAGHILVRDPVDPHTFWINPLGKHYALMKALDMIRVDYDGNLVEGKAAINKAGFMIHSELHKYRPDINAACHTHLVYGKAWSLFARPLEMLNQDVCMFYKCHLVFLDFGGVALEADEGKNIAKACGPNGKAIVLANHGLLTVGQTVDEAAYLFTLMERLCEIQLLAEAAAANGIAKQVIGDEEAAYTYHHVSDPETLFLALQPDIEYEEHLSDGAFKR